MMRKFSWILMVCLIPGLLFSQTEQDAVAPFIGLPGPGGRATGLAQAFTGVADDYSAVHYNPAGLAHITWAELSAGGTYYAFDNTYTTNKGQKIDANSSRNNFHTNSLGYVWPVYGLKFSLGVGYNTVALSDQAFTIQWQDSSEYINEESVLGAYTIAGGYQLQKEISVGVSFHLFRGSNVYSSQFYVNNTESSTYEIDSRYTGVGLTAGLLWAPTDFLRTGFAFKSPKYLDVDETLGGSYSWNGNYQIQSPPELRLGQSVNLGNFLFAGTIAWKNWANSSITIPYNENLDIEVNHNIQEGFTSVTEWAVGGEYLIPGINIKLRGGLHHIPGYRDDESVGDKMVYSGGVSVVLSQQFKIDWGLSTANWTETSSQNPENSADISNTWSTVNFAYRF